MDLPSITVYCGARPGRDPRYMQAAYAFGQALAARQIRLVYGGARNGLMGEVARGALESGGAVTGVIPQWLVDREIAHRGLTELHIAPDMHARKKMLSELGSAYVALPGGFGTLEELTEMFTWAQIGLHKKPIGILNVGGYYNPLIAMAEIAAREGFMAPEHLALWQVAEDSAVLLDALTAFTPPPLGDSTLDMRRAP